MKKQLHIAEDKNSAQNIGLNSRRGNYLFLFNSIKMIAEILKVLEEVDQDNAITIREIAEVLDEAEKKIAGVLLRLRKKGWVGFEKRAVEMIAEINYTLENKKAERIHRANPYHYWGCVQ